MAKDDAERSAQETVDCRERVTSLKERLESLEHELNGARDTETDLNKQVRFLLSSSRPACWPAKSKPSYAPAKCGHKLLNGGRRLNGGTKHRIDVH